MGIRMNLNVGYGIDLTGADMSQMKYENLKDPDRFEAWRDDVLNFAKAEDDIMEKMIFHNTMNPPKSLADLICYDDEFGIEDKALFFPSGSRKQWSRYGNIIDAFVFEAESGFESFDYSPEWTPHPGTLYPYIGLMKENKDFPLGVEKYWIPCYRDNPNHQNAVAWAPWHLWFLIKHMKLWPEEDTTQHFLSLRPVVYRYWS